MKQRKNADTKATESKINKLKYEVSQEMGLTTKKVSVQENSANRKK